MDGWMLTTVGTKGGLTFRNKRSSHDINLKNACFLTSSASLSLDPSLLSGFLRNNYKFIIREIIYIYIYK